MSCTTPRKKRICLVGTTCDNFALTAAAQKFNIPVLNSAKGVEYIDDITYNTYFILNAFEGCEYNTLCNTSHSILGPTALLQLAEKTSDLPSIKKPLYTQAMISIVVVFSGFRARQDELRNLANMVLNMGGSIKKTIGIKVTHLISNHCTGEKYRYADTFGLPIMSIKWITALWNAKDNISIDANNEELIATYKLKPFYGAKICFFGFPGEEETHMLEIVKEQDGQFTQIDDPYCTHIVVDESNVEVLPNLVSVSAYIVTTGWFWTSVQNEAAADETEYLFEHYLEDFDKTLVNSQQIATLEDVDILSSGRNLSPRQQVFRELVETESNYVGILYIIMTLFKLPLENLIGKSGKELLNSTEAKIIFGNFPPIYHVHKQLLEALQCRASHWTEDTIGNIILKFEPDLVKAYPPYVNFFENTKQMLDQCDQNKPRFHAFLKNCQTIPECGKQSLIELLIKPVQRLPSITLLLNDILKHTNSDHPDHSALKASINCIKRVMTYINEDKRKTERQLKMFDIFNEIDNCPPCLVSSHRSLISKCDVIELTEGVSRRGDHLVLFLFSDTLEICKKRSKGKLYKHLTILSLDTIRKVIDIRENKEEFQKVFALLVRGAQDLKETTLLFAIDEEVIKTHYLKTLAKQIAIAMQIPDSTTLLISRDQLEITDATSRSTISSGTLSKTIKFPSRTKARIDRVFNFNKAKSKLNRVISVIISPFGSLQNLATTNLQELDSSGNSSSTARDHVLMAPASDQPPRKTYNMVSLLTL